MSGLAILIPCALGLGLLALAAFYWSLNSGQFDDIEGAGQRILLDSPGDEPRRTPVPAPDKSVQ
ncbi:cbb3-type cytochrome oxidase assembly protein CcoS [uncultured Devosia sp.]|uniref:cbb3-type cytochrome oxidase assembly protein CcoS n=1 Tax=uncultured Devosia sp. TaxID=211434 RepID=UPI00260F9890|nr:cbb3-type cytochrome oxidase assembly protein CcoS [uncultured Devosia sp.]